MKDIHRPHLLLKFQPKIWKSPVTSTCPKFLYNQKTESGPLGVNFKPYYLAICEVEVIEFFPRIDRTSLSAWCWDYALKEVHAYGEV